MEPVLRNIQQVDWITFLLFGSLLLIVLAKSTFYNRFLNFIILPFNNKYIFMYNKKEKLLNWFHVFFTLFQVINFSLFIYLALQIWFEDASFMEMDSGLTFPLILGGLLMFLFIKVSVQLGNGFIFNSNRTITELIFKKLSYLNYSSLVMFVANVLLCYVFKGSLQIVYAASFLILLINAIGWVTLLRNHQNFLASNFFYFILYLCALEIAPFILLGSYLND